MKNISAMVKLSLFEKVAYELFSCDYLCLDIGLLYPVLCKNKKIYDFQVFFFYIYDFKNRISVSNFTHSLLTSGLQMWQIQLNDSTLVRLQCDYTFEILKYQLYYQDSLFVFIGDLF